MKIYFSILFLLLFTLVQAQDVIQDEQYDIFIPQGALLLDPEMDTISVMEEQSALFDNFSTPPEAPINTDLRYAASAFRSYSRPANCFLRKQVYGYHPYWMTDTYFKNYDYSLLSTFIFFGMELNATTGGYKTLRNWETTNAIALAQQAGCRVEICVLNFGGYNNHKFLTNPKAWSNFVATIKKVLDMRNADGINLDFEDIYQRDRQLLVNFARFLSEKLRAERPNISISMTIPPVNINNTYDVKALSAYTDKLIIMAYDYTTAKSKHAGPVAPMNGLYSLKNTLNSYLKIGLDPDKFILAVPYYGREWKTTNARVPAPTVEPAQTVTYSNVLQQYRNYKPRWHSYSESPYIIKVAKDGTVSQCWFESKASIEKKYNLALEKQLGGVAIWALGYDDGYPELWDLIDKKFVECGAGNGWQQKQHYQQWLEDYFK
jgi:spore germination protein YaaH